MAQYPAEIYTPRTMTNRNNAVYDAARTKDIYAEDFNYPSAEIVAIQTELGTNPKGAFASVGAAIAALVLAVGTIVTVHSGLSGLDSDDHTQYAFLAGRATGQTMIGGTAASENLSFQSTAHATKGKFSFDTVTLSTISTDRKSLFFGELAGNNTFSGGRSVAIGYDSGNDMTTPYDNTFIGYRAGSKVTTGQQNVFIGSDAGFNTGVAVGACTFIGYNAGATSTGSSNTGIGVNALTKATGGTNTAIGRGAGQALLGGSNNVFVGYNAGSGVTTGVANILIGGGSGITTAGSMIVVGASTMTAAATGERGIAIGNTALRVLTSGNDNVCFGTSTGYNITTTSNNTIIGSLSGATLDSSNNTLLGFEAGRLTTTGDKNTFLGTQAGRSNLTGASNVFVGYNAGYYETGSNKLFIDNLRRTNEATARTSALIYGVFDATVANQTITCNASVAVTYAFGCNGATAQTSYASGGAVTTSAGDYGFSSDAERASLTTLVANIRLALVANGIMS